MRAQAKHSSNRNRFAQAALVAVAAAVLSALFAAPASAALVRNHESSFGAFTGEDPQGLAVDQANGDLYVISSTGDTVSRFNSSGLPKDFTAGPDAGTNTLTGFGFESFTSAQVAIDNSGGPADGAIYVTDFQKNKVKIYATDGAPLGVLDGSGTPSGAYSAPCSVAVDQSNGDLYVGELGGEHLWRYTPSGGTVVEADYSGGIYSFSPCSIAVATGSLYAAHYFNEGPVRKYALSAFKTGPPPSPSSSIFSPNPAWSVATDPSNGDVYVDKGNQIVVFSSSGGTPIYSFGSGDFGFESAGVAVRAGGNAYVSDPTNHQVDVYGPFSAPPPLVKTEPAFKVGLLKATLYGHFDLNESLPILDCEFEWGTDTTYSGGTVPCVEGDSFTEAAEVSGELTGLSPGTTYHFRLRVTTGAGKFSGNDQSFQTTPPSSTPVAVTGKSTATTETSAQLNGTVNTHNNPLTDCRFEYVDDLAFQLSGFADLSSGGSQPCSPAFGSIPVDFEDHPVSATVSGLDPAKIYRFRIVAVNANGTSNSTDAVIPGPPFVETTGSPTRTATTARFDSRVNPHAAPTNYHFEYVTDEEFQANGFDNASSTSDAPVTSDEVQRIQLGGNPGPGTEFKLSFGGKTTPDITAYASAEVVQTALRALPAIGPDGVSVTFVEIGDTKNSGVYTVAFQGPLASTDVDQIVALPGPQPIVNSGSVITLVNGGPGSSSSFVSAPVEDLQPATTYRYRVVAESANTGGPVIGDDMTLTTRASDVSLSHGDLPGPPGSDRAWEQVTPPDTGGNPVFNVYAFSDEGDRAIFSLAGGNPGSEVGSFSNQLFSERTVSGWKTSLIYPKREQALGNEWEPPAGRSDLSSLFAQNFDSTSASTSEIWRIGPGAPAQHVFGVPKAANGSRFMAAADDGSRVVTILQGSFDPDHPVTAPSPPQNQNLYDVTSGAPRLVSLLPDGSVPNCGAVDPGGDALRAQRWISTDGSLFFFLSGGDDSCGSADLFVRNLDTETTTQITTGNAGARFIRSTAGAVFFTTFSNLVSEDNGGRDVYRYDLDDEALDCLTCFGELVTDVIGEGESLDIAVSDDGSRVYFSTSRRLLPGAFSPGLYRVDVASGDLAYVAPGGDYRTGGQNRRGNAISPDGSVFVFRSSSPTLNSVNGQRNGGTAQYYRYDDTDRSLVCVSCPVEGSAPRGEVSTFLTYSAFEAGPNMSPITSEGDLAFATPTSLSPADQNTAGSGQDPDVGGDVYEWRDGRLLLITDGLTVSEGKGSAPEVAGVSPSGRDVFFVQAAQLTPDAIDANARVYDARIGGGFEFPKPPPPCPLEVCQGTPKGAPEDPVPSSGSFSGRGDVEEASPRKRCGKGKRRVRRAGQVRCVKRQDKQRQRRANHNRRTSR